MVSICYLSTLTHGGSAAFVARMGDERLPKTDLLGELEGVEVLGVHVCVPAVCRITNTNKNFIFSRNHLIFTILTLSECSVK